MEPEPLLQMKLALKSRLINLKKYLSDAKILTPLSQGNLIHEVCPRASLTATETTQSRDKQKWKK